MKATINNTAPIAPRNFEIGDIVIDNNDGHVVLVTDVNNGEYFDGITLVGCVSYGINEVCKMMDDFEYTLFVGTITLEN